jgi:hypothetical protein
MKNFFKVDLSIDFLVLAAVVGLDQNQIENHHQSLSLTRSELLQGNLNI